MQPSSMMHPADADLFRLLVDRVVDYAIFLLTPDGHVASWNVGAERLKGYSAHDVIGQSFEQFYTPEDRAAGRPRQLLSIATTEGRVEDVGWRVRKDGERFWADVVITALRADDGRLVGFAKVTRDMTEPRQAEEERTARRAAERAAERMDRLRAASAALAAVSRQQAAADVLVEMSVEAFGAPGAVVAFPAPDGQALEIARTHGQAPDMPCQGDALAPADSHSIVRAWQTRGAVFDTAAENAWAAVPLLLRQDVLAVLGVRFVEARALDADERGLLSALAEVGAQALDRARLYEDEQRARAEAEAALHAQDEFLSIASHELRSPVAAVKATAQLAQRGIQRGGIDAQRLTRHLESIARVADRLAALVDDLLDVSRLRTGQLKLRGEVVDLRPLVQELVAVYSATANDHEFDVSLAAERVCVHADPLRLEQVLDNLLSNAVKYSPAGGTIQIGLAADQQSVTLTVTDSGIGLPAGQEARIFEPFGRASNAAMEQIPGLGLGLAICRQLIEAHAGRIWATSPGENEGTTVCVWLPRVEPRDGQLPT